jgi:rhodanese-related sulfurtransferase
MKLAGIIILIVGAFASLLWLTRGNETASAPSLTFAAVQSDVKNGARLYDVRTADEYKTGHFVGALNWSLIDMQAAKLPDVAKSTKLYVYCHSGNRSSQAAAILTGAGYTNVTDLHGLADVESIGGKLITE